MEPLKWTLETYRLDEVERKFGLPCVIHLNEGYYSLTDAEGFSQGDIMSIDSKLVLHKVAANFAKDVKPEPDEKKTDDGYIKLPSGKEILIPLNYKGNLKVIQHTKTYESVKELVVDFPRYARLRQNMSVVTEDNKKVTMHAGTVIELDRIIPGATFGTASTPDRLIIQFDHLQRKVVVALPLNLNGKFITEQDTNEYTIKEAIDRYSLPQYVRFVDDEIKRVYTRDLDEGISNIKRLSDTYRLNRLVTQEVLVGHYKPVEEDTVAKHRTFKQRTLILLSTDNPEIRDIEVNVLQEMTDDTYEHIFLLRNVSRSQEELMDGALYIDFADCPGIRRFSSWTEKDDPPVTFPPPLPPKPIQVSHPEAPRTETMPRPRGHTLNSSSELSDSTKPYFNLATLPRSKPRSYSECSNTPQSDKLYRNNPSQSSIEMDQDDYVKMNSPELGRGEQLLKDGLTTMHTNAKDTDDTSPDMDDYQEVEECLMVPEKESAKPSKEKRNYMNRDPSYANLSLNKPTATVSPTSSVYDPSVSRRKLFKDLSTSELVERLKDGGLNDFSQLCKRERLNGAFFLGYSKETLIKEMGLKKLQLVKFLQMRDENWIPT